MRWWLVFALCWFGCGWAVAAEETGPDLPAVLVNPAPAIDGDLGDEAWTLATRATGFMRDDLEKPAAEETEVWVCYDRKCLYVAFGCQDRQPGRIRALQTKRGGGLWSDDWVMVTVDPHHSHDDYDSFSFCVNPRGTQDEQLPGGSATQIGWKGDWQAAARVTQTGWQAEMAVLVGMHLPALHCRVVGRTGGVFNAYASYRQSAGAWTPSSSWATRMPVPPSPGWQ